MDPGPLSGWTAASISAVSAVASLIGWWRSRTAKAEATEQAQIATQARVATADNVKRLADMRAEQQQAEADRSAAGEVDPWTVEDIPGWSTACNLRNNANTPKYGVKIEGPTITEPNSFDVIGPGRHARFGVFKTSSEGTGVVTWHQHKDRTDAPPQSQPIEIL